MEYNDCMLTTVDNPFNPFKQFDAWLQYDSEKRYYSCSRLARIAHFSDDMTEKEVAIETERAIDEIIKYDFTNTYKKVRRLDDTIQPEQ